MGAAERLGTQPDSRFVEYNFQRAGQNARVLFYRYGADNSQLQLSYASFYRFRLEPSGGGTAYVRDIPVLYGLRTSADLVPKTGTASYSGIVFGSGSHNDGITAYEATGTSKFNINFSALSVSGNLDIILTKLTDGTSFNFGTHTFVSLILNGAEFSGPVNGDGSQAIRGFLFGPGANEIGAGFDVKSPYNGVPGDQIFVTGVTVGKRD